MHVCYKVQVRYMNIHVIAGLNLSIIFICVGKHLCVRRERGHANHVNLIPLLVPCVFSLELTTASKDPGGGGGVTDREGERDLIRGNGLQMNREQRQ